MEYYDMLKYEVFITDVHNYILDSMPYMCNGTAVSFAFMEKRPVNTSLDLIFDYDKCNDFAKIIMDKTPLLIEDSYKFFCDRWYRSRMSHEYRNESSSITNDARSFVQTWRRCEGKKDLTEAFRFVFWSLAILTVDKQNIEEHMIMISNFVKMLCITEEELYDILQVVKLVFGDDKDYKILWKSETIYDNFSNLIEKYFI